MKYHSNKYMRNMDDVHQPLETFRNVIPGESRSEEKKVIWSKDDKANAVAREMKIWDFITGKDTSILNK